MAGWRSAAIGASTENTPYNAPPPTGPRRPCGLKLQLFRQRPCHGYPHEPIPLSPLTASTASGSSSDNNYNVPSTLDQAGTLITFYCYKDCTFQIHGTYQLPSCNLCPLLPLGHDDMSIPSSPPSPRPCGDLSHHPAKEICVIPRSQAINECDLRLSSYALVLMIGSN